MIFNKLVAIFKTITLRSKSKFFKEQKYEPHRLKTNSSPEQSKILIKVSNILFIMKKITCHHTRNQLLTCCS